MPSQLNITQVTNDDIIDISLKTGTVHRSFTDHILVVGDKTSMAYGVRITFSEADGITVPNDTVVTGFFIRPDHNTVTINGQHFISGNQLTAVVLLPQECYAYAGQFSLVIKVSMSTCDTALRIVDGTIVESYAGGTVIPGQPLMSIDQIIAIIAENQTSGITYYKTKQYTCEYTVEANDSKTLTGNMFNTESPQGYSPIACGRFSTGDNHVVVVAVTPGATGTSMMMVVRNTSGSDITATARFTVVYMPTST